MVYSFHAIVLIIDKISSSSCLLREIGRPLFSQRQHYSYSPMPLADHEVACNVITALVRNFYMHTKCSCAHVVVMCAGEKYLRRFHRSRHRGVAPLSFTRSLPRFRLSGRQARHRMHTKFTHMIMHLFLHT